MKQEQSSNKPESFSRIEFQRPVVFNGAASQSLAVGKGGVKALTLVSPNVIRVDRNDDEVFYIPWSFACVATPLET